MIIVAKRVDGCWLRTKLCTICNKPGHETNVSNVTKMKIQIILSQLVEIVMQLDTPLLVVRKYYNTMKRPQLRKTNKSQHKKSWHVWFEKI